MPRPFSARLRALRPRLTRRRIIAGAVVLALLVGAVAWAAWPTSPPYRTEDLRIAVRSGPSGNEPVDLDARLFLPDGATAGAPVPAVLLAHGFGGTKEHARADAEDLAALGYAVLTYTARGFGLSGGQIHLDNPDYEVRDAQRLLDWLAARPDIRKDAAGDPRVGVVGGSYGGGLALLLAAQDQRVDAIVPMITWNDLARSFLPEDTGGTPENGVFKKQWAGLFFGGGAAAAIDPARTRRAGPGTAVTAWACRPSSRASTRRAAGSPPTSAPPTCASRRPAGPTPTRSRCCAGPARPVCSTGSRRRRCSCRARPTRSSRSPRRTPTRAGSRRPARPCGSPGSPGAMTAAKARSPTGTASGSSWRSGSTTTSRAPGTPRRRRSPGRRSPASTRSTAAWSPAGSPATSTPGSAAPRRPR